MSIGSIVSMAEAIEWNCCGLSLRETGTKKGLHFVRRKIKTDFLFDFFVLFLYINLHLLQTKRGHKKWTKKCLHTITYTTITTITTPPPDGPWSGLFFLSYCYLWSVWSVLKPLLLIPCAFTRSIKMDRLQSTAMIEEAGRPRPTAVYDSMWMYSLWTEWDHRSCKTLVLVSAQESLTSAKCDSAS